MTTMSTQLQHRHYYSREYETTSNNRPSSPSPSPSPSSSPPPRRRSPISSYRPSPQRSQNSFIRKDYKRPQHQEPDQEEEEEEGQQQQETFRERRKDNNTNHKMMHKGMNEMTGTGSIAQAKNTSGGSSPNSVMGLNVRDLASRYGGKVSNNYSNSSNHHDSHHYSRRRFSRSSTKPMTHSTIAKTKIDGNNSNGDIECTLGTTMSTDAELNESNDSSRFVPQVQSYLQRQRQRSKSRSPILRRSERQVGAGNSNNNNDEDKNEDETRGEEVNNTTPVKKKWGWPSPKRYDNRQIENNNFKNNNISLDALYVQGETQQVENDNNQSSKSQYLQVLKQSRNQPKNVSTTQDESIESNVTILETRYVDTSQTDSTMKPFINRPKTRKFVQNQWGRLNNSSRNNYRYSNHSLNDSSDTLDSSRFTADSKHRSYQSNDLDVVGEKGEEDNNHVVDITTVEEVESKIDGTTTPMTVENKTTEDNSVLDKTHFWRNQLSNQRNRTRSPTTNTPRHQQKATGISNSNPLSKKSSISRPTISSTPKQERYLTAGLKVQNDRTIPKSKSSESLVQTKSSITNNVQSQALNPMGELKPQKESSIPNSKSTESLVKEFRDHNLHKSKTDSPSNPYFSRHIQYMQSTSKYQYQYKDDLSKKKKNTFVAGNGDKSEKLNVKKTSTEREDTKFYPKSNNWSYHWNKENNKVEKKNHFSTSGNGGEMSEDHSNDASADKSKTQDEQDSFQGVKKNKSQDESNVSAISNSFEKYKLQSKSYSPSTLYRSQNKNRGIVKERVDSPIASISSSYEERLRNGQTKMEKKHNSFDHEEIVVKQSITGTKFESHGDNNQKFHSKPSGNPQHKPGRNLTDVTENVLVTPRKEPGYVKVETKESIDHNKAVLKQTSTNKSLESADDSRKILSKSKPSLQANPISNANGGITNQFITPQKDSKLNPSRTEKDGLRKDNQKVPEITPRRTAMENFIEAQVKSPESVSPSRKSLHDRIRKFDTGGEVPMPVPHCKLIFQSSPKREYQTLESVQKEEEKFEEKNNFQPLIDVSDSEQNFEDEKNDATDMMEIGEESTIADYSLSLSVSEAKARLWNAKEELQAWPNHAQNDAPAPVPVPSPTSSDQMKANFKSKLFVRAAEAAQSIRRTSSTESHDNYKQNDLKNQGEKLKNMETNANNIQPNALSPQVPTIPHSNNVESNLNPRQLVTQSIQSKPQKTLDSTPANSDLKKNVVNQNNSSIAKLMAKLASVKRDNPTAALQAIDSILRSEKKELGMIEEEEDEGSIKSNIIGQCKGNPTTSHIDNHNHHNHEQAMSENDDSSYFSDSDDSTVSAITDPTYQSGFMETSSVISYSTVSRNGKKRQFSYHVSKDGGLHHQYTSTRTSHHRSKKYAGHLVNHHSSLRHHSKSPKPPNALNTSFSSDALNSSNTMLSPPLLERRATAERSASDKPKLKVRGGMSSDNQRLIKTINTWDGGDMSANNQRMIRTVHTWDGETETQTGKPTAYASSSNKQPTSPTCSERVRRISSKEHTSPSDKIKRLARVADGNPEHLMRRDKSPGRRFLYPPINPNPDKQIYQDTTVEKEHHAPIGETLLPENIASAFDDVNVSFGSQNVHALQKEMNYSFLSPLKKKFSKVERRYKNNDP